MSAECPLARSEGLVIEALDGELLVYDRGSNLAHVLDAETARLWRGCDGRTGVDALAVRCAISHEQARMTLERLAELGLTEAADAETGGETRRTALRKIAIGGAGLASASAISSIVVPIAAAAGSCAEPGTCVAPGQTCCAGHPVQSSFCEPTQMGIYGPVCCVPAGSCAVSERDIPTPTYLCCNGTGVPDSSCTTYFGNTGYRCT